MPVNFTSRELSEKYDRFAPWYDWVEGVPDLLGVRRLRRRLLRQEPFQRMLVHRPAQLSSVFHLNDAVSTCYQVGPRDGPGHRR